MALWELDEFKPATLLGYVRGLPDPEAFSLQRFLPNRFIDDIVFEYIRGANRQTVMAHVMGFDSEAPLAGREALGDKIQGDLPPIKRKARISEKELLRFLQPRSGSADKDRAIESVYDQIDGLVASIQARIEWLRGKALSEDTVVYDEAGVKFVFDYGLDDTFQVSLPSQNDGDATDLSALLGPAWSTVATSTPINDMVYMTDLIQDTTGYRPATQLMSGKAISYLQQSVNLRDLLRGENAPTAILALEEINALLQQYDLPSIERYDAKVTTEAEDGSTSTARVIAEETVVYLPAAPVGETVFGPTAESRVLLGTALQNQTPGVFVETYGTTEPPAEYTKAAAIAFPTMPDAHLIGQLEAF